MVDGRVPFRKDRPELVPRKPAEQCFSIPAFLFDPVVEIAFLQLYWTAVQVAKRDTNRTLLIDVHAMPVFKELVAYLVIEGLYKEMALLPDSPVRESPSPYKVLFEAENEDIDLKNTFSWNVKD